MGVAKIHAPLRYVTSLKLSLSLAEMANRPYSLNFIVEVRLWIHQIWVSSQERHLLDSEHRAAHIAKQQEIGRISATPVLDRWLDTSWPNAVRVHSWRLDGKNKFWTISRGEERSCISQTQPGGRPAILLDFTTTRGRRFAPVVIDLLFFYRFYHYCVLFQWLWCDAAFRKDLK